MEKIFICPTCNRTWDSQAAADRCAQHDKANQLSEQTGREILPCPVCHGKGKINLTKCSTCDGTAFIWTKKVMSTAWYPWNYKLDEK